MKKLIIIGASAMGRETCVYAQDCGMKVKGFLDSIGYPATFFTGPGIHDFVFWRAQLERGLEWALEGKHRD